MHPSPPSDICDFQTHLLKQAVPSFAKRNIPVSVVLDRSDLDLSPAHCGRVSGLGGDMGWLCESAVVSSRERLLSSEYRSTDSKSDTVSCFPQQWLATAACLPTLEDSR